MSTGPVNFSVLPVRSIRDTMFLKRWAVVVNQSIAGESRVMRARGGNGLGRFSVEIEVANYGDLIRSQDGNLPADQAP